MSEKPTEAPVPALEQTPTPSPAVEIPVNPVDPTPKEEAPGPSLAFENARFGKKHETGYIKNPNATLKEKPKEEDKKEDKPASTEKAKEATSPEPDDKGDPKKPEEKKPDESPKEPVPEGAGKKAKDRIQELAREKNKYKADFERVQKELEELKKMKDEDKKPKDWAREALLEDKVKEEIEISEKELLDYANNHPNRDRFVERYNTITPELMKAAPGIEKVFNSFGPDRWKIIDEIYDGIATGRYNWNAIVSTPLITIKEMCYQWLDEQKKPEPPKKLESIPESIKPNFESKVIENKEQAPGTSRAFEMARSIPNKEIRR